MKPRSRRAPLVTAIVSAFTLLLPLGGVAVAEDPPYLDLNPETSKAALRSPMRMAATLTDATGQPSPTNAAVIVNFEVDGPGDPGTGTGPDGVSFDSPDLRCTVAVGSATCRKSYQNLSGADGQDKVWAWIDGTTVDETEGQSVTTEPGSHLERDGTDVATPTWFAGLSETASLDCSPEASTVAASSSKTITCTVKDGGTPLDGWQIDAENLSPTVNDPDDSATGSKFADYNGGDAGSSCVTGDAGSGQCRMTIAPESPAQAGRARICFWVDEETDGSFHPDGRVEWDGTLCDTESVAASEADNRTDAVAISWKFRRSISLKSSKKSVARGKRFKLSGSITANSSTCKQAQKVVIRRDVLNDGRPKKFSFFKSTTSGSLGAYSISVKARKGAKYQARLVTSSKCYAAGSGAKRVRVRR
ncbi:MAG: hypothetical protein ABR529_02070 [Actinomycetota bacterium]